MGFSPRTLDNVPISFNGTATLGVTAGGSPVPAMVNLSSGSTSGTVRIDQIVTGAVLQVSDGAGHTGTSNPFDVSVGAVHRFAISAIASPQGLGAPFAVTMTAKDAYENTVPSFEGIATLSAGPPPALTGVGTGLYSLVLGSFSQQREQTIYTASEMGPAGKITALSFQADASLTGTIANFTVRLKHTALGSHGASPAWEATGWTTVYQGTLPIPSSELTWMKIPFTTPFQFDGTSNVMVDISHNGASVSGFVQGLTEGETRTLRYAGSGFAAPTTWSGTSNPVPTTQSNVVMMRVQRERVVPLTPATTGNFAGGVWSGNLTLEELATGITVVADHSSGVMGESNVFSVSGAPVLSLTPATDLAATALSGGAATPVNATWTLSNTGTGPMVWNATRTAPWLTLSPASGTLASGASLTVTATIDAAGIAAGSHADTITFTNASTGAGNTTRAAALTVVADTNANRLPDDWDAEYGLTAGDTALADRDGDGVPNVFEHALCLNPTASDGDEGYWTTTETNPADDKRYLVLHYRRRLSLVGWAIDVETSMNASQWSSLPGATEPSQAPTPLPGGIAEIAPVRVLQPMGSGGSERAFVRLKIRSL